MNIYVIRYRIIGEREEYETVIDATTKKEAVKLFKQEGMGDEQVSRVDLFQQGVPSEPTTQRA